VPVVRAIPNRPGRAIKVGRRWPYRHWGGGVGARVGHNRSGGTTRGGHAREATEQSVACTGGWMRMVHWVAAGGTCFVDGEASSDSRVR